jgi:hypothetical protein
MPVVVCGPAVPAGVPSRAVSAQRLRFARISFKRQQHDTSGVDPITRRSRGLNVLLGALMKNILGDLPNGSAGSAGEEDSQPSTEWRNGWIGLVILLWGVLGFAAAIAATLD